MIYQSQMPDLSLEVVEVELQCHLEVFLDCGLPFRKLVVVAEGKLHPLCIVIINQRVLFKQRLIC